jgi:outer membrane protein OmpA-like peptidoglycan-associated protein
VRPTQSPWMVGLLFFCSLSISAPALGAGGSPIQAIRQGDGVILWTHTASTSKPIFFSIFERLANVAFPSRETLPFDRSVAFLVGVSNYKNLDSLPFVKNDLQDMKNYLLLRGGFDEIYVASDEIVTHDLIEEYMMNKFPRQLKDRDRLLFYYAGHGADARGTTGYMQFAKASPGDFARNVLSVDRVREWSRVNGASHMLFILDTCSSGLAFTSRAGDDWREEQALIQTLSGQGSRTVVTAGIAGEKTFEVKSSAGHGNGIFTQSLLVALERNQGQRGLPFLIIDQVMADVKIRVAKFAQKYGKPLHPKHWSFEDTTYPGTFVFLNPDVQPSQISDVHLNTLKAVRGTYEPITEAGQTAGAAPTQDTNTIAASLALASQPAPNNQPAPDKRLTDPFHLSDRYIINAQLREMGFYSDVYFENEPATSLNSETQERLIRNADLLSKYSSLHLRIEGYDSSERTPGANQATGERNARVVKDVLVNLGIPAWRLHTLGYGAESLSCVESARWCSDLNRRVHMVITGRIPVAENADIESAGLLTTINFLPNRDRLGGRRLPNTGKPRLDGLAVSLKYDWDVSTYVLAFETANSIQSADGRQLPTATRHLVSLQGIAPDGIPNPIPIHISAENRDSFDLADDGLLGPPVAPTRPEEIATVNFPPGSARLSNIAKVMLDEVAGRMKRDPEVHAQVPGTDMIGEQRAQAVKNYLVTRHGIDPSRISNSGRGNSADGESKDGPVVVIYYPMSLQGRYPDVIPPPISAENRDSADLADDGSLDAPTARLRTEGIIINFPPGSARLSNIAKAKLDEVAGRMKRDPEVHAQALGTDMIGEQRAQAVKNYLVTRHGIDPSRISNSGRGNSAGDESKDGPGVVIYCQ